MYQARIPQRRGTFMRRTEENNMRDSRKIKHAKTLLDSRDIQLADFRATGTNDVMSDLKLQA